LIETGGFENRSARLPPVNGEDRDLEAELFVGLSSRFIRRLVHAAIVPYILELQKWK
jgi:hypothetical protein